MKTKITLKSWHNTGILATWHTGTVKNNIVLDSTDAALNYFVGLFWEPVIIDRRGPRPVILYDGRRSA